MRAWIGMGAVALVAGCASPSLQGSMPGAAAVPGGDVAASAPVETLDPTPPPPPPPTATTVAEFDTTTAEDRQAALDTTAAEPAGEEALGTTIATLGDPADPGIWLKTPLVGELTTGRVVYGATGKSINLELRPSGGEPGSGSQISLPAMRLLEAPLTGLIELEVFAGGGDAA